MTRPIGAICAVIASVLMVGLPATARADAVADWYEVTTALGGGPPTLANVTVRSQTALAMFEAADAIDRRYQSYLGFPAAREKASAEVAVAVAASDILKASYPEQAHMLQSSLDFDLAQVPEGPEKTSGIAIGHAAAQAAIGRSTLTDAPRRDYVPAATPGVYVPTDLPVLSLDAYRVRCWFLARPDEVAPPRPPVLTSKAWADNYNEVRRLGRRTGSERTPSQTAAADFWAGNTPDLAMRLLGGTPGRSLVQNARVYAKVAMGLSDAYSAITTAKYDNAFWRPITAIRNGAADGNDATAPDSAWEPYLRTPLHPEYPCGHCIQAATVATILAAEFGKDAKLTFVQAMMPGMGVALTPAEYDAAVSMSRIYAGVHYRFSNEAAQDMGHRIGERANRDFMKPLAK